MDNATIRWMLTLRHLWQEMRASFWFVPALIVVGAVFLASVLIGLDANVEMGFVKNRPILFGAGAEGSRGLLTAVASSMITVAGVVFSITIVALSLTSSQYTSRVLRNFMKDPVNQVVLGVFLGIFAYCLVVLRTIRGGAQQEFVPALAVLFGLILAFFGIAFLIYFIHHIAISIQASSIIAEAANETICAVDHLFPQRLEEVTDEAPDERLSLLIERLHWLTVVARRTGYVESIDVDALFAFAREHVTILRMEHGIGDFVIEGTPLISASDSSPALDDESKAAVNGFYVISRQRTVRQDAAFGIRQIVDIALKALSPGINDTTTAVTCVDYLAAILVRLANRRIPTNHRLDEGQLRLIARGPSFDCFLNESFDQIRQNAEGNEAVLNRLLQALESIAGATVHAGRRQSIRRQAELTLSAADRSVRPQERARINAATSRLLHALSEKPAAVRLAE
jgi:uncharacterized membrane protein